MTEFAGQGLLLDAQKVGMQGPEVQPDFQPAILSVISRFRSKTAQVRWARDTLLAAEVCGRIIVGRGRKNTPCEVEPWRLHRCILPLFFCLPLLEGSGLPKKYGAPGGGRTDPCWFSDLAHLVSSCKKHQELICIS